MGRIGLASAQTTELVAASVLGCSIVFSLFQNKQLKEHRLAEHRNFEAKQMERERRARLEPKISWDSAAVAMYDGNLDPEGGPILIALDGYVYNVWKGRNFYGLGGPYSIFAGKDATRLLAKGLLEEETLEVRTIPLTLGERAVLSTWVLKFKAKYECLGRFEGPS